MQKHNEVQLVVVTGMSGAGKTVAAQCFEDLGYFCVDNLPPILISKFAELLGQSNGKLQKVALIIDLRGRAFFSTLLDSLKQLEEQYGIHHQILFLEADDDTLVRRYKETRRRHPLAPDGTPLDGIRQERMLLQELREKADNIIDTSRLRPLELKQQIQTLQKASKTDAFVTFMSFGFKHGIPIDADLVFDVRFLPNPHYVDELRPQTGREKIVSDYVMKWEETKLFLEKIIDLLTFLIPQYKKEGKSQLVVAIGCTGGKHRSVAIAEHLYHTLKDQERCQVKHRDMEKGG
ncbi:RNase adapter RapZ [Shimazuella sp. AN120528]|uniref:RNase adapter RapZ n=1 Tax=Shimazuella soli TaxID=1892854 RepID=UPI001F108279|nr:RNase adapter RapZ [Shimazuella soli]MCH5586009.1 RNase adapter RapZ [Shimazuella soli]